MESPIVSVEWLKNNMQDDRLILLNCFLKPIPEHLIDIVIPGTRFFDLKAIFRDTNNDLPNSFPSPEKFQDGVRNLGINKDSKLVIYDAQGIYSSPRVYYLFKAMGHENVAILDGGLPAWIDAKGETVTKSNSNYKKGDFVANYNKDKYKSLEQVEKNIEEKSFQILDARSKGRFDGTAPEPRLGLKSGHIVNSKNLAFTEVLQNGHYKSKESLKEILKSLDVENQDLVFSCGSGVTACIIMLAVDMISDHNTAIFDGSWTEWGLAHQEEA